MEWSSSCNSRIIHIPSPRSNTLFSFCLLLKVHRSVHFIPPLDIPFQQVLYNGCTISCAVLQVEDFLTLATHPPREGGSLESTGLAPQLLYQSKYGSFGWQPKQGPKYNIWPYWPCMHFKVWVANILHWHYYAIEIKQCQFELKDWFFCMHSVSNHHTMHKWIGDHMQCSLYCLLYSASVVMMTFMSWEEPWPLDSYQVLVWDCYSTIGQRISSHLWIH